ncbi:MAG TPA: GIY-YIG nuclease family protein [Patescibacteria group bacterium]
MYWIYILQSQKNDRYYIGSSNDIERRLAEHNRGKSPYTASTRPWKLVFSKEFATLKAARQFEHSLKKQKSRKVIEELLAGG